MPGSHLLSSAQVYSNERKGNDTEIYFVLCQDSFVLAVFLVVLKGTLGERDETGCEHMFFLTELHSIYRARVTFPGLIAPPHGEYYVLHSEFHACSQ